MRRTTRLLLIAATVVLLLLLWFPASKSGKPTTGSTKPGAKSQIAAPPTSLVATHSNSGAGLVTLKHLVADAGCPPPKAALIGIFTVAGAKNAQTRQLLRQKYRTLNANLDHEHKVDFKFVLGNSADFELDFHIATEQTVFPDETFVTDELEDRDSGKILAWFKYARSQMYSVHPVHKNQFCLRYRFIGKGDEDAVWHSERLANALVELPSDQSHYVGRSFTVPNYHMTGMLYLLSADIVEWINFSPVPVKHLKGVEDVQVGKWVLEGGFVLNKVDLKTKFHDLEESPMFNANYATHETIAIHWCKDPARMFRCMSVLFDSSILNPATAFRLSRFPSIKNRADRFQLNMTTTNTTLNLITEEIQQLYTKNKNKITLKEIDSILVKPFILSWCARLNQTTPTAEQISHIGYDVGIRAAVRDWKKGEIDDMIVLFILRTIRIPELGLGWMWWEQTEAAKQEVMTLVRKQGKLSTAEVDKVLKDIAAKPFP
ncbi:hypothetical protein BDR26DRAFT_871756 [Obelidium mucronatum]|nr:hypothetical protein BDR26DRAFT_871756 [Obelidium mucronatum]